GADQEARVRYTVAHFPMLDQPFGYLLSFLAHRAKSFEITAVLVVYSIKVCALHPSRGIRDVSFCSGSTCILGGLGLNLYGGWCFAKLDKCSTGGCCPVYEML